MHILTVAQREIKLGFRNSWTYSFLILLSLFTIGILLLHAGVATSSGYTDMTGTVMNMILYLLPLITLLLGAFSVALEKEDGHWGLLATYPLSTYQFLGGKWIGLAVILLTMLLFSFGLAGMISVLFHHPFELSTLLFFWTFSAILSLVYLSIAIFIGAIAKNRWQALVAGIGIWFLTVIAWPLLLIGTLSQLPSYKMIQPTLQVLSFINPAEMVRVFSIMRLGAGSAFGADYDQWITWATSNNGFILFIVIVLVWFVIAVFLGGFIWNRRDKYEG